MRLISLLLLAFWQTSASAEILFLSEPTGASVVSNYNPTIPSGIQIFGGTGFSSGFTSQCTGDTVNPCDNCTSAPKVCNKRRIYDTLNLTFRFLSTSVPTSGSVIPATPLITYQSPGGEQVLTLSNTSGTTLAPNTPIELSVRWETICDIIQTAAGQPATGCDSTDGTLTINIGVSPDNSTSLLEGGDDTTSFTIKVVTPDPSFDIVKTTNGCGPEGGICSYSLFKGDGKAFIRDLILTPSGLGTYKSVFFYCSDIDHSSIQYTDVCAGPVAIAGINALENDVITNLPNGVEQHFAASVADEAGNIGLFLAVNDSAYSVIPEEVVGLFDENSCFIATAAYGSPMEKNVKILRAFRDRVLAKSSVGQLFVKAYYTLSPPLAKWIAQSPNRRSVARAVLTPIVLLTSFMMESPWLFCFSVFTTLCSFVFVLRRRREPLT
jgi:hypothetical protein